MCVNSVTSNLNTNVFGRHNAYRSKVFTVNVEKYAIIDIFQFSKLTHFVHQLILSVRVMNELVGTCPRLKSSCNP